MIKDNSSRCDPINVVLLKINFHETRLPTEQRLTHLWRAREGTHTNMGRDTGKAQYKNHEHRNAARGVVIGLDSTVLVLVYVAESSTANEP
jgi:hypothetical protein